MDLVWGEDPPPGAHGTLHSYLSGVRRVLEPGLGPRQKPSVLLTSDHGYRLDLRRDQVDAHRFADEVRAAAAHWHRWPASSPPAPRRTGRTGRPSPTTSTRSRSCSALWSGEAYADLPDHPEVALERSSLDQLRRGAEEDRVLGLLALGDHAVVVAATEQATARYSLEERVWALHALALARSGRQAESLAALRHIRRVLADELGLDPGQELRDLEQAVLVQDPVLQQWLRADVLAPVAGHRRRPRAPRHGHPAGARSAASGRWPSSRACSTGRRPASRRTPCSWASPASASPGSSSGSPRAPATTGFVVATGRCAQDDGAPPLWPWSQALGDLGRHDGRHLDAEVERLLSGDAHHEDAQSEGTESAERQAFRAWESIAHEVLTRSEASPLLLVLEDLHWADTASLRVLRRLVASTAPGQRLAVRRHPPAVPGADRRAGRRRRGAGPAARGPARPRRSEQGRGRARWSPR